MPEGGWVMVSGRGSIRDPWGRRKPYGGAWGKGVTVEEAKRNGRREGLVLSFGYEVIVFGPESTFEAVDCFGRYSWTGPGPVARVEVPERKALR